MSKNAKHKLATHRRDAAEKAKSVSRSNLRPPATSWWLEAKPEGFTKQARDEQKDRKVS
jgi:hypothetical protein